MNCTPMYTKFGTVYKNRMLFFQIERDFIYLTMSESCLVISWDFKGVCVCARLEAPKQLTFWRHIFFQILAHPVFKM